MVNLFLDNLRALKAVLAVVLVLTLAVAAAAASHQNQQKDSSGPIGPLTVWGYVYDITGWKLVGATVLVEIVETGAKRTEITDSEGKYQTSDFSTTEYDLGHTIRVTATYDSLQHENSTKITQDIMDIGIAQVDVQYTYVIPEFGSMTGAVLAGVIVAAVAAVALGRRAMNRRVP